MALRSYWTIVMEGRPTAFRAARRDRDALLPTLKQLQSRHPETHLMWFSNGRYWRSPEDAFGASRRRQAGQRGPRGARTASSGGNRGPRDRRTGRGRR
jgi:hypothetical protein